MIVSIKAETEKGIFNLRYRVSMKSGWGIQQIRLCSGEPVDALRAEVVDGKLVKFKLSKLVDRAVAVVVAASRPEPSNLYPNQSCLPGGSTENCLEGALTKCLEQWAIALKDLADAAKRVDKAAFGQQADFAQARQALLRTARCSRSLDRRNLPATKNPDSRLSLLDLAGLGKLPDQPDR